MTLSEEERASLAAWLWDTLGDSSALSENVVERAWYDEAERRITPRSLANIHKPKHKLQKTLDKWTLPSTILSFFSPLS